jgi:hypothetical protein
LKLAKQRGEKREAAIAVLTVDENAVALISMVPQALTLQSEAG